MRKHADCAAALGGLLLTACGPVEEGPAEASGDRQAVQRRLPPTDPAAGGAWVSLDGRTVPARYLCDGVDRPQVIVVLEPNADRRTSVAVFDKIGFGPPEVTTFTLGPPDAAAGHVREAFRQGGAEAGYVRRFDPGAGEPSAVASPPAVTEIRLGGETTRCRWDPNTRFQGFTAQRSVLVVQLPENGLTLNTFDFDAAAGGRSTQASLRLGGGREEAAIGSRTFRFADDTAIYRIGIRASGASLQGNFGAEPFVGWASAGG